MQNGFNKGKKLKKYMKVSCCRVQLVQPSNQNCLTILNKHFFSST